MKLLPELNKFVDLFEQFKDHLIELNQLNDLTHKKDIFIPLSNLKYDHDLTKDQDLTIGANYFQHHWSFKEISSKVFSAKVDEPYFVTSGMNNSKEYLKYESRYIEMYKAQPQVADVLSLALHLSPDPHVHIEDFDFDGYLFSNSELKSNHHHFYFNALKLLSIDNNNQKIHLHGTYQADTFGIEYLQNEPAFVKLSLLCAKPCDHFYQEILLDAYSQLLESNYKMAFFNAFAAFDNFVNTVSDTVNVQDRLSNKFTLAYATKTFIDNGIQRNFAGTGSYSKLKNVLDELNLEQVRNDIAHANQSSSDWAKPEKKDLAIKMYIFSSMIMLCYQNGYQDFKMLRKHLKEKQSNQYSSTS